MTADPKQIICHCFYALKFVLVAAYLFETTAAPGFSAPPIAASSWQAEYSQIAKNLEQEHSAGGLNRESASAVMPGSPHSLYFGTDKDPLDVVIRRTQALLDHRANSSQRELIGHYQAILDDLKKRAAVSGLSKTAIASRQSYFMEACALRRTALFSDTLLSGISQLLFIERGILAVNFHDENNGDHHCDEYYGHNGKRGGGLYILKNPFTATPEKINILLNRTVQKGLMAGKSLNGGSFCSPDLSFDGKTIAFAWSPGGGTKWAKENRFRIFTVSIDGSNLTQLTGEVNEDDFDPCWLPGDKRIVFISTRRGGYGRCHGRLVPTYTLYSMKADGSDLFCIDWHETNEFHPSINNDGMIVYTRWDYVDRDAVIAHHFWLCWPDGRDPRSYHGNYPLPLGTIDPFSSIYGINSRPMSEFNYRAIPGSSSKYVATSGPHHGQAFGNIITVDIAVPDDGKVSQIRQITSGSLFSDFTGEWGTPWPLSENLFICNYRTGLYVIDNLGNRELIYKCTTNQPADTNLMCSIFRPIDPIPLRAKKLSDGSAYPELACQTYQGERASLPDHKPATILINNVNVSDMPFVSIPAKWLRIVQLIPKATPNADNPWTGYATQSLVRMALGVVPVESDGSVYCEAPVNRCIYFQLLDSNGLAIRSMRSATYVHQGERMSCVGCHENKWKATPVMPQPLASKRPPSKLVPETGTANIPFNWYRQVKPVLQASCAPCHIQRSQKPDMTYASLKPYAFFFEGSQGNLTTPLVGGSRVTPGKFGARYAKLTKYLDSTHYDVKLTSIARRTVTMWLDLNCNELGAYNRVDEQKLGKIVYPEFDFDSTNPTGVEKLTQSQLQETPVATLSPERPFQIILRQNQLVIKGSGANRYRITLFSVQGRQIARSSGTGNFHQSFPLQKLGAEFVIVRVELDRKNWTCTVPAGIVRKNP